MNGHIQKMVAWQALSIKNTHSPEGKFWAPIFHHLFSKNVLRVSEGTEALFEFYVLLDFVLICIEQTSPPFFLKEKKLSTKNMAGDTLWPQASCRRIKVLLYFALNLLTVFITWTIFMYSVCLFVCICLPQLRTSWWITIIRIKHPWYNYSYITIKIKP